MKGKEAGVVSSLDLFHAKVKRPLTSIPFECPLWKKAMTLPRPPPLTKKTKQHTARQTDNENNRKESQKRKEEKRKEKKRNNMKKRNEMKKRFNR